MTGEVAYDVPTDPTSIFDSIFYGNAISTALFGITAVQGWVYFNKNEDKWPLRLLVTVLLSLDLTVTILNTQIVYHYLVSNFGIPTVIQQIPTTLSVEFQLTVIVAFLVELFFASRLYYLGHNNRKPWIPAIVVFLALSSTVIASVSFRNLLAHQDAASMGRKEMKIEVSLSHALAALSAIVVTWGLSTMLNVTDTVSSSSNTIMQRLLVYVVTRGFFVTCVQLTMVVLYIARPVDMTYWMALRMMLTKVYVMTMIAMLNSRSSLRATLASDLVRTNSMYYTSPPTNPRTGPGPSVQPTLRYPEGAHKYHGRPEDYSISTSSGDSDINIEIRSTQIMVSREQFISG